MLRLFLQATLWLLPGLAWGAEAVAVVSPHLSEAADSQSVALHGRSFVNGGLAGAGQLAADTIDFLGDTLGSFSSLQVEPGSWKRIGDSYEGILWTLPDRGRNEPEHGIFFDYVSRLHRFRIHFTPQDGKLIIEPIGGLELRDFRGKPFTGADPGAGTLIEEGVELPSPVTGAGSGKVSLDAESLQLTRDGFYIGDEYTANVYWFDREGSLRGVIRPPVAIEPRSDGRYDFTSLHPPATGRRNNQGVESLSLSPDGGTLFVVLQSALMQDSADGNAGGRINARVLVYDVRGTPTPAAPTGHYIVQLPAYRDDGDGRDPNRTAAQSEIRAINDHQFLMLARDAAGRGAVDGKPIVYKSILLVDTSTATNLAASEYETSTASVLRNRSGAALHEGIEPAEWVEFINLLNPTQLSRFGLSLDMLSEKWEAMDLLPADDPERPRDYFLLVGNDNDFIARRCRMAGESCDSDFDNDNRLLVYRVSLP